MAKRPCLDCGALTTGTRCREHRAAQERGRKPRATNLTRDTAERNRRAAVVAAHRAQYGDWCPGWQAPPHPATDLTADHIVAIAAGGHPSGPLQVLCRACNGRKSNRTPRAGVGGTPAT